MYKTKIYGFTLIEVIVTVIIIAILSTIGFVSYTTYLISVRDTKRVSDITAIYDGLQSALSKGSDIPNPDSYVTINSNGALLGYQGYIGGGILSLIGIQNGGIDPKDDSYYSYYLYKDNKSFQLMTWLEDSPDNFKFTVYEPSIFPKAYAGTPDYINRFPKVHGKPLGILTDGAKTPLNEVLSGTLDIATTTNTYTSYFTDTSKITGTGGVLINSLPNANCKRIRDTGNGTGDGVYRIDPTGTGGFDVRCDMTGDGGGWTLVLVGSDSDISLYDARGNSQRTTSNTIPFQSNTQSFKFSDALMRAIRAGGMYKVVARSKYGTDTFYVPSTCNYIHTSGVNGDCAKLFKNTTLTTQISCSGGSGRRGIGCRPSGATSGIITNHSQTNNIFCYRTTSGAGRCSNNIAGGVENIVLKLYVK